MLEGVDGQCEQSLRPTLVTAGQTLLPDCARRTAGLRVWRAMPAAQGGERPVSPVPRRASANSRGHQEVGGLAE